MTDTTKLRGAVLDAIRDGKVRQTAILGDRSVIRAVDKLPGKTGMSSSESTMRYVDSALQALKRDGEIKFTKGKGWRVA